jgi:sugar (pentulose or hexulose) kinase
VAGVNDGMASVLGAGLREPGDAVDTGGTSGGIAICADRPLALPGLYSAPSPLPGRWILGGAMAATGAAVDWLRTAILGDRWTVDELFRAAASVPPGTLPYSPGARLIFDAARGAFVGLTLAHAPPTGASSSGDFAVRHGAEPFLAAGIPLRSVRIAGRPTPDDLWARIKADVLGVPAVIPVVGDTAVVGAAILAAAGVGAVGGLEAGVASMTSIARTMEPDRAARPATTRCTPSTAILPGSQAPTQAPPLSAGHRSVRGAAASVVASADLRGRVRFPTGGRVPRSGTSPRAARRRQSPRPAADPRPGASRAGRSRRYSPDERRPGG